MNSASERGRFARVLSATLVGLSAARVRVEADIASGLPGFSIVGLPSAGLRESRERIGAALRNSGFHWPDGHITVSLAPADLRKDGAAMDLAIALAILFASGQLIRPRADWLRRTLFVGELALDGALRSARGVVAITLDAPSLGVGRVVVPASQVAELEDFQETGVHALAHLRDIRRVLHGGAKVEPCARPEGASEDLESVCRRLAEVRGQERATRAVLLAAAGGHHLMLEGPPGCGKTLLARRLAALLPPLDRARTRERRRIHSALGRPLDVAHAERPPLRAPHHSSSAVSLVGGGRPLRPGEVTLAHGGVLLLDELPEFGAAQLDRLREPLMDRRLELSRMGETLSLPCAFQLVGTGNPCPCGWFGSAVARCHCTAAMVERYRRRISGPLRDRIDLWVEMDREPAHRMLREPVDRLTTELLGRIRALRAEVDAAEDPRARVLASTVEARQFLARIADEARVSARRIRTTLRVASTIAGLDGRDRLDRKDIAEAFTYRPPR